MVPARAAMLIRAKLSPIKRDLGAYGDALLKHAVRADTVNFNYSIGSNSTTKRSGSAALSGGEPEECHPPASRGGSHGIAALASFSCSV